MFNVRLAGGHLYGKQLFTWLSLVVSFMASFVLSFFPLDVLDGIWDLIESVSEGFLNYSCLVIQWITPCHENHRMTRRVITLWYVHLSSLTTSVSTMHFLLEILSILKAIKSHFKGSYDKQNLALVVISY